MRNLVADMNLVTVWGVQFEKQHGRPPTDAEWQIETIKAWEHNLNASIEADMKRFGFHHSSSSCQYQSGFQVLVSHPLLPIALLMFVAASVCLAFGL